MIPQRIIQAWFDKARLSGSDVMRWNDFLETMIELRHTDTQAYTAHRVNFNGLPIYDNEAAALAGGLNGGDLYRTSTGEVRIKLPNI